MKTQSAKAKCRLLQNWNHRLLHLLFPQLHEDDIKPAIMGSSGEDQVLSPAARARLQCSIENKNQQKTSPWSWFKQAKTNSNGWLPIVVFTRNREKVPLALLPAVQVFAMIKELSPEQLERVRNFSYEMKD